MERIAETNDNGNLMHGKLQRFYKLLNVGITVISLPMLLAAILGFKTGNVILMGCGCFLLAVPILINYFRDKVAENVIVRRLIAEAAENLRRSNRQYEEGNLSLEEYMAQLRQIAIPDLEAAVPEPHTIGRIISDSDYGEALNEAAVNVSKNESTVKFFVLDEALTKEVIKISPTTYYKETNKYLNSERSFYDVEPYFNSLLEEQRKRYVEENKSLIVQMNYNLKELYKIKERRNEQEYKKKFEETMGSSWVSGTN